MKSMKELLPTLDRLRSRAEMTKNVKPSDSGLEFMDANLSQIGYQAINEEVYSTIRAYGALLRDGTAKKGLFLKGECGIGKSFGVECLAYLFEMPVFKPDDFASMYKELEGNMSELEKTVTTGCDFFERPQSIVIDELGSRDTAKNFGETVDIMSDVIDMRYRAFLRDGVLTIITTNLSDREIVERYGVRIEDRMHEMFFIKRVSGVSLRRDFALKNPTTIKKITA